MNNSPVPRILSHPMETDDWQDALTGEQVIPDNGMMNISLDPYGYRILKRNLEQYTV
ncbi:hypothetical protein D3C85_1887810 [compost metagenome]